MTTEGHFRDKQLFEAPNLVQWDSVSAYGRLVIAHYNGPNISLERYDQSIADVMLMPISEVRSMKKNGNIHDLIFNYKREDPVGFTGTLDELVDLSRDKTSALHARTYVETDKSYLVDIYLDKLTGFALKGIDLQEVVDTVTPV